MHLYSCEEAHNNAHHCPHAQYYLGYFFAQVFDLRMSNIHKLAHVQVCMYVLFSAANQNTQVYFDFHWQAASFLGNHGPANN